MHKSKFNKYEPTKQSINEIILFAYSNLLKKCIFFYIKELECSSKYLTTILNDLAEAIMSSTPE